MISMQDGSYYYPTWSDLPDYQIVSSSGIGSHQWMILDLIWPATYNSELSFNLTGALFHPETFEIWDISRELKLSFSVDPNQ